MAPATAERLFGKSIKRREDPRFITGRGSYVDDLKIPGMTYAAFVRSPHAHARIRRIDTAAAKAHPGVVAVFTGSDMKGVNSLPCGWDLRKAKNVPGVVQDLAMVPHMPLTSDVARHVGDPVAVVIADSQDAATDAAEKVRVDWEPLPSVTATEKASASGAAAIHADAPGNVAFKWALGDAAATDAAFKNAAVTVKKRIVNQRLVANAMEPRACVARFDPATGELTLWVTSQNPHVHRLLMCAFVLGIPEHKVRVIAPDVGGGFGSKIFLYNEEVVCSWASRQLQRPIRWTASRREAYQTDAHGRDHVTDAELALSRDGKILGLRVKTVANLGAYLSTFAPAVPTFLYGTLLNGVYTIGAIHVEVTGVFTNTTAVDAYRGAGRPEACYVVERMVDAGARALNMDVADLRRKNFIPKFAGAFQTLVAVTYDSGNYAAALDKLLQIFDYKKFRAEQAEARKQGKLLGVGFSTYIEACSIAPSKVVGALGAGAGLYESGKVRVHPTGMVTVYTGSHSHGQGHETTFAQLVADDLGIPMEQIEIVHGDTGSIPFGMGTYGSRSASVGGTAIQMSLDKIKEKGKRIAAHLLEASPKDMEYANGQFQVKGVPSKAVPFGAVALTAYIPHNYPEGLEPGLEETSFYDPSNFCFPFGAHACVVEVDADTGKVKLLRYVAVDDVGNVINPMIVDGMVHGGIAQGVGQALWEGAVYDGDSGQLVTGSMMDYAMPKADMLPNYETDRTVTPTPVNPLGVKGAGETGTIAATPAVVNAVVDALAPFGVDHIETMPLTAERVWKTIQAAKARR
ncbi:MAG: carbon monoxide dehydrogenase [Candidatus Rokubacteria bacterium 13_1_20CM_2_68_19]|nr:MAG: carbon monoxide dehydrogenase [Candidatus Rokubacteria bacterium 13_1_40CM_4_67_11]OLD93901.1 MAG: carbon monoxide dehydrogenase [Candidatus Rokubacteria bacterium 13_1_20CM_4_68_9]OLE43897.1 MAG: carbon monoxide dehydrogenase [Candidatus Rokubacteria bacterium 13_1_20CM_2_68_19]PYN64995.1 MAG: carbon monoxide dehydrogenase [Candidatus Rokubacteria bacterium]